MPHVLIAGVSTRAAAESAAAAGFEVTALDAFADLDQHPGVRALSLPRDFGTPFSPRAVVAASRAVASDASAYLSSLENHPRVVAALAAGRQLWGNPPAVLRRVRNPRILADTLRSRGYDVPATLGDASHLPDAKESRRWLLKPRSSGGGQGIRWWNPGEAVPSGFYVQSFVDGVPASIVFVAAGGQAVALGMSRQLAGESAFGARGFRYCGSIMAPSQFACDDELITRAIQLAGDAAGAFGLVGVGGVDFIAADGVPHPIEVNPRWSASMELAERLYGLSVFAAHAAACTSGALPVFDLPGRRAASLAIGKAILFASNDCVAGDTHQWLSDPDIRDVPRPGEHIPAGQPVCTIFATAADDLRCHDALVERAARVYAEIERT